MVVSPGVRQKISDLGGDPVYSVETILFIGSSEKIFPVHPNKMIFSLNLSYKPNLPKWLNSIFRNFVQQSGNARRLEVGQR
jgi:hypothetical protein